MEPPAIGETRVPKYLRLSDGIARAIEDGALRLHIEPSLLELPW